ncbi:rifin [Plasmodium reichenowi]|uniref:Rifin n=1 Tax=Plasmodium reichenowi TaxID=5854 RepID=A0A060RQL9_PLARE|nr:rifin [Plasmodium reichenowi]
MKVHYINALLFALPLNILANYKNNKRSITTPHTQKIPNTRLLCECELYAPSNYDNDLEMKSVMENFNKQTQQRFHEYDDRMIEKRKRCKEQCDKEIQKIILKDKLEKQMEQQLTTLETKIDTDDIPTCFSEKSLADKVEKTCLRYGRNLGVAVPGLGVLGAYGAYSMVQAAIAAGIKFATQEGIQAGTQAGIQAAIKGVKDSFGLDNLCNSKWKTIFTANNYSNQDLLISAIEEEYITFLESGTNEGYGVFSFYKDIYVEKDIVLSVLEENAKSVALKSGQAAERVTTQTAEALTAQKTAEATSVTTILSNPIVISFIVVVIIVILFLIIYLILRYRRKKKMKKKHQYIKLLEE